jgi:hypothetical protein
VGGFGGVGVGVELLDLHTHAEKVLYQNCFMVDCHKEADAFEQ